MKKSVFMACMCALALNVVCSSRSNSENVISADTTALQGTIVETEGSKKYENEYYSLTVPNDWEITESIYDRRHESVQGAQYRALEPAYRNRVPSR